MKQAITTKSAPAAIGAYSQAVRAGDSLYISGQLPIDPQTGNFAGTTIEAQTEMSLKNVQAILREAGMDLRDVVKVTVFLNDMDEFAGMNSVYATFFEAPYPGRAAVEVSRLPRDAKVEIEAIAYQEQSKGEAR